MPHNWLRHRSIFPLNQPMSCISIRNTCVKWEKKGSTLWSIKIKMYLHRKTKLLHWCHKIPWDLSPHVRYNSQVAIFLVVYIENKAIIIDATSKAFVYIYMWTNENVANEKHFNYRSHDIYLRWVQAHSFHHPSSIT